MKEKSDKGRRDFLKVLGGLGLGAAFAEVYENLGKLEKWD
jgi:hypothetical protein